MSNGIEIKTDKTFSLGFLLRTKDLLERYTGIVKEGDREVTLFFNCLTGILVNVKESYASMDFF